MSTRDRLDAVALLAAAVCSFALLAVYASRSCPAATELDPCSAAALHRVVVVALASVSMGLLVAPFAFVAEFAARRRIVYRGAWARAARRALLAGMLVAVLAGLRLGGALSPPVALFVLLVPIVLDTYLTRAELRA